MVVLVFHKEEQGLGPEDILDVPVIATTTRSIRQMSMEGKWVLRLRQQNKPNR